MLPSLNEERHSLSAVKVGNSTVYAIGGSSAINYGSSLSSLEKLDFNVQNFDQVKRW